MTNKLIFRTGDTFTKPAVCKSVAKFLNYCNPTRLVIGSDPDPTSKLCLSFIQAYLSHCNPEILIIKRPVSKTEVCWVSEQEKCQGVYISQEDGGFGVLAMSFIDKGSVISDKEYKSVLKASGALRLNDKSLDPVEVSSDLFGRYMLDKKLITPCLLPCNLDLMFGAAAHAIESIEASTGFKFKTYNNYKNPERLEGYISSPSGRFLKWYTTFTGVQRNELFFAIDKSGSKLGMYDLRDDLEVSSSFVACLLTLFLFKEGYKEAIIYEKGLNPNIKLLCNKLGVPSLAVKDAWSERSRSSLKVTLGLEFFMFNEPYPNPYIVINLLQRAEQKYGLVNLEAEIIKLIKTKYHYAKTLTFMLNSKRDIEAKVKKYIGKVSISLNENLLNEVLYVYVYSKNKDELEKCANYLVS